MNPVASNPLLGVFLHGIGAGFAATCYTPQKQVKRRSWQTDWLTQASFCWFLLPIIGAMLTIPQLMLVLFSNLVGLVLREWRACRRLTDATIVFAFMVGGHGRSVLPGLNFFKREL